MTLLSKKGFFILIPQSLLYRLKLDYVPNSGQAFYLEKSQRENLIKFTGNHCGLVHRLIATQFPQWADLPIKPSPLPARFSADRERGLASTWQLPSVWVHGDIAASNLLVKEGKLAAVIDFGCMGIGDPACDLAIAWTLFDQESRAAFRAAVALESETWARARGWALWKALCAAFPGGNGVDRRVIDEILADHKRET